MMKKLNYGKDYQYDHDLKSGFSGQEVFSGKLRKAYFL